MKDGEQSLICPSRILLLILASALVSFPQLLWAVMGYRGAYLISLETFLVVLGFLITLIALMDPLPGILIRIFRPFIDLSSRLASYEFSWKSPLSYTPLFLLIDLAAPYGISRITGAHTVGFVPEAVILIISAASILLITYLFGIEQSGTRKSSMPYYLSLGVIALTWTFSFWYGTPRFPTDEMTVGYYSAHILLGGKNPYIPATTQNLFSLYTGPSGFPMNIITPFTTGGYVTSLSYPSFSIYAFLPSQLLGFPPSATFIPLYAVPILFLFWAYRSNNYRSLALVPSFFLLLDPSYLVQVGLGYSDIVWVIFLMISLYFYRKAPMSGAFMGLASSVKQIPWLVIPFFLYFVYRQSGRRDAALWGIAAVSTFILVNLPFILLNPAVFMHAVLAPELQKLIGIGFGPSQLSFLDLVPLSRFFFLLMLASVFAVSIIGYIVYYKRLSHAFLAFPIIIFLFNYRLLLDYLMFWPIAAMVMPLIWKRGTKSTGSGTAPQSHMGGEMRRLRKVTVPVVLAVILVFPAVYQVSAPVSHGEVGILGISHAEVSGSNVTEITAEISITHPNLSYGELLYRIMPAQSSPYMNGFLWKSQNMTSVDRLSESVSIIPDNPFQSIPSNGNYRLIVYYGGVSASETFTLSSGTVVHQSA